MWNEFVDEQKCDPPTAARSMLVINIFLKLLIVGIFIDDVWIGQVSLIDSRIVKKKIALGRIR
jgi:hypothetical protein